MPGILFVCSGNTCRSPMAEYLMRDLLEDHDLKEWEIKSAGVFAGKGEQASSKADKVLQEIDIDVSCHHSTSVNQINLQDFRLILTMTEEHKNILLSQDPEINDRVYTLKEFAGRKKNLDIEDPFGKSLKSYRELREELQQILKKITARLKQIQNQKRE